jgi:hypothetical protein
VRCDRCNSGHREPIGESKREVNRNPCIPSRDRWLRRETRSLRQR